MTAQIKKIENTRRVVYLINGAQPMSSHGSQKIDPRHIILNIDVSDGTFRLNAEGPQYRADGKLGSRLNYAFFYRAEDCPPWLNQLVADEGLTWPEPEGDDV